MVGRSQRHPVGAVADRDLVVVPHGGDRRRFSYPVLLGIRFLFGMGEAGAWPCVARTFSRWIPGASAAVQGVFFAGAHLVGGLTPALVLWLLRFMSWRAIFVRFGGVGLLWVAVWHTGSATTHRAPLRSNAAELQTIVARAAARQRSRERQGLLAKLFRNRNMIAHLASCISRTA